MKAAFLVIITSIFSLVAIAHTSEPDSVKVCLAGKCENGDVKESDLVRSEGLVIYASNGEKIAADRFMISYNIGEREYSCINDGYMLTQGCKEFSSND